jgi:hypothetical protein
MMFSKSTALALLAIALGATAVPITSETTRVCHFDEAPTPESSLTHNTSLVSRQSTWNPPSNLVTALDQVWKHEMETYNNGNALGFKNYGYDQVIANKGKVNYCVRWESSGTASKADRDAIQTALRRSVNKWNDWLKGFDGWPYQTLDVNVVGWAVSDKNKLTGDVSGIQVYTDKDSAGAPQCAEACGRFFHQNNDYSKCAAGAARHYGIAYFLSPIASAQLI